MNGGVAVEEHNFDLVLIGKRVKEARRGQGITQEELAHRCNCSTTHMSHIENGKIGISVDMLMKLSKVLEVSMDYFFLDCQGIYPQTKIDTEIAPKLTQLDLRMLSIISNLMDELLDYQKSAKQRAKNEAEV
jgi:transcriptional regulator with XRE-family HTH domain